jgi:hypothetical protein
LILVQRQKQLFAQRKVQAIEGTINTVMSILMMIISIRYNTTINIMGKIKMMTLTESKLLRQTNEERKALKRSRGPNRKSSRSIVSAHKI